VVFTFVIQCNISYENNNVVGKRTAAKKKCNVRVSIVFRLIWLNIIYYPDYHHILLNRKYSTDVDRTMAKYKWLSFAEEFLNVLSI